MKSKLELNKDIISITTLITEKYPELVKYINEMPVKLVDELNEESSIKNLVEYYESLDKLLKNYKPTHKSSTSEIEENSTF